MQKPVEALLNQLRTRKFAREDDVIHVHLFTDVSIMKLVRVAIALAVGLEIIDKLSPTVKCFPIGRTFLDSKKPDSIEYVSDYNYQDFLNYYCETQISDYSNYKSYLAWKKTCPMPAGLGTTCSEDLQQLGDPEVQNCTKGTESILAILKSKQTSFRQLLRYIIVSITNTEKLYECRPRTLYYYVMSWSLLVFAVLIALGPSLWNFLFADKIADRIRHIKYFVESVVDEDADKQKEMKRILREEVQKWDSTLMSVVAYIKTFFIMNVSFVAIMTFVRGFRYDIDDLGITVCKVHDFEYARCASPRVGLIRFVWFGAVATLCVILFLSCYNFIKLINLTCTRSREAGDRHKMFLTTLLKEHLGLNVFNGGKIKYCFSDLMILAVLCEKNRDLFGTGWRRFNRSLTITSKLKKKIGLKNERESVL